MCEGIKGAKAGRKDDRSDLKGDPLLLILEVHCPGGAEFLAGPAFALFKVDASLLVDDILERHGLRIGNIDGLSLHQAFVVFTVHLLGAFLVTCAAGDTFIKIDVSRVFQYIDFKPPLFPSNVYDLGKGEQLYVQMPADLDQFRRKDSHGAVIGGECLVEL